MRTVKCRNCCCGVVSEKQRRFNAFNLKSSFFMNSVYEAANSKVFKRLSSLRDAFWGVLSLSADDSGFFSIKSRSDNR